MQPARQDAAARTAVEPVHETCKTPNPHHATCAARAVSHRGVRVARTFSGVNAIRRENRHSPAWPAADGRAGKASALALFLLAAAGVHAGPGDWSDQGPFEPGEGCVRQLPAGRPVQSGSRAARPTTTRSSATSSTRR